MSRIVISIFDDMRNPYYGGGGATVVDQLAQHLSRTHSVTVLSGSFQGWRRSPKREYCKRYLRVGWAGPRAGQALFHLGLPLYARFLRYDLWIESFTPPISTSFLPRVSHRRPVVALVQMLTAADASARYRLPFGRVERLGVRQYKNFLVLNREDQAAIEAVNHDAQCRLVRNGISLPPVPSSYGGGEYVLFLGRIDVRQKGLDLLIDAYARCGTSLPLVIAGAGPPREERWLLNLLANSDAPITYIGHVSGEAKNAVVERAAFMVLPSRYETFGLSALEAMSYGKPVVHFDLPRLSWIPAAAGLKVEPFDTTALAGALLIYAEDTSARASAARHARVAAEAYDWETVGLEFAATVSEFLEEGTAEAARPAPPVRPTA